MYIITKVPFSYFSHIRVQVCWPATTSIIAVVSVYKLNTQNALSKAQGPL